MTESTQTASLEIGQLDLRYAHTRIRKPEAVLALMRSMEKWGQIRPVSVAAPDPCHVLVDGYLRVEALKRNGKDTVLAEVWRCGETEALLRVLIRKQERRWEVLEEASVIRELHERHQMPQDRIARLLGKDKSWVSRRLSLLCSLPDEALEAVRRGRLSTWAAGRVLAPLARANPDHALALTQTLSQERLSTRDLDKWFRHYQKANRKQRERMAFDPVLFLKALRAKEEERRIQSLKEGPEGKWLNDMKAAGHILARLAKTLASVIYPGQGNLDRRLLLTAFEETRNAFLSLEARIREATSYDEARYDGSHPDPERKGRLNPGDQPDPSRIPKHGAQGASGQGADQPATGFPL